MESADSVMYVYCLGGMAESIVISRADLCAACLRGRHQILHKYDNVYTAERERASGRGCLI